MAVTRVTFDKPREHAPGEAHDTIVVERYDPRSTTLTPYAVARTREHIGRAAWVTAPWLRRVVDYDKSEAAALGVRLFPSLPVATWRIRRSDAASAEGFWVAHQAGPGLEAVEANDTRDGYMETFTNVSGKGPRFLPEAVRRLLGRHVELTITRLAVDPHEQNKGLGRALVRAALASVPPDATVHFTAPRHSRPDVWAHSRFPDAAHNRSDDSLTPLYPTATYEYEQPAGTLDEALAQRQPWQIRTIEEVDARAPTPPQDPYSVM